MLAVCVRVPPVEAPTANRPEVPGGRPRHDTRRPYPPHRLCVTFSSAFAGAEEVVEVASDPATVILDGPSARYSLLITGQTAEGRLVDRTHVARFESNDPRIARIDSTGVVQAVADGATTVQVQVEGARCELRCVCKGAATRAPPEF